MYYHECIIGYYFFGKKLEIPDLPLIISYHYFKLQVQQLLHQPARIKLWFSSHIRPLE